MMKEPTNRHVNESFPPVVAAVGGIDPSGGAGLFIDQMAIQSAGCHFTGICAILTIQNGAKFVQATPQPPTDIETALMLLHQSTPLTAIKTGALGDAGVIDVLCEFKARHPQVFLVADPVVRSTTGGHLFSESGELAMQQKLLRAADLITPNIPEATALLGRPIASVDDMTAAVQSMLTGGIRGVLLKGGHLESDGDVIDILGMDSGALRQFRSPRLNLREVRGTGCALASLIASQIALGESVENGVEKARSALLEAMANARFPHTGPGILQFMKF